MTLRNEKARSMASPLSKTAAILLLLLSVAQHSCEARFSVREKEAPETELYESRASSSDRNIFSKDRNILSELNPNLLQLCIDKCQQEEGYCCGNRLNGEVSGSSYNRLSCANGCEIAFYSKSLQQCKNSCADAENLFETSGCTDYQHQFIPHAFRTCSDCQPGCPVVHEGECEVGCRLAEDIPYFYQHEKCQDDPKWSFKGRRRKTCESFISRDPKKAYNRCKKKEKKGKNRGKKISDICPVACRCAADTCAYCGPQSGDDLEFQYNGSPSRTCQDWVKDNPTERCELEGVKEACPSTCGVITRKSKYKTNGKETVVAEMSVRGHDGKKYWQTIGEIKDNFMGVALGYHPAGVRTENGKVGGGTYGWSYYLRTYDLVRDSPVDELGWGQWTSGAAGRETLTVCGRNPRSFVCDPFNPPSNSDMQGPLKNCGSEDLDVLKKCTAGCCGDKDKCGNGGGSNIEGGLGYWMYTLETPHVKWMGPAAVNHWYQSISGTFMPANPNPCTKLGGAVRVANSMVVPNDQVQFHVPDDGNINGFMGYMLSRSPIGKRHAQDKANFWTIFLDTANYSGPVYYISSWFWDSISAWHPESLSWADPDILINYAQQGIEGRIGGFLFIDEHGNRWIKTNEIAVPRDKVNDEFEYYVTLSTAHSKYTTDWAVDAMEPLLSGTGSNRQKRISYILEKSQNLRKEPDCYIHKNSHGEGAYGLSIFYNQKFFGFGVGDEYPANDKIDQRESEAAHCYMRLKLNKDKLNCDNTSGFCTTYKYIKVDPDDPTIGTPVPANKVPTYARDALNAAEFEPNRANDGRYYGPPAETEKACFDMPGPADPKLYCTRLQSGTWVGFKWYRFVDQPELNQVFASMKDEDRNAAKCYMQERIERLHDAVNKGGDLPRWFQPPQGDDELPADLVSVDPGYLVTPPPGLEKGFVPIPMWERNREPSPDCDVFLGEYSSEPEPFPDNYYEGHVWENGWYHHEQCPANLESNGSFKFPGTVYPYPHKSYAAGRQAYEVPLKANVANVLEQTPVSCGLDSDPPNDTIVV